MNGVLKNTNALVGGMRIVELKSKGQQQTGRFANWVYSLALVIAEYFDTDYFTRKHHVLQVVFYGIKHNADCAGYAFAATFNRITKLSADFMPIGSSASKETKGQEGRSGTGQNLYIRLARASYKNGIIAGLEEAVRHERKRRDFNGTTRVKDVPKIKSKSETECGNLSECSECWSSEIDSDEEIDVHVKKGFGNLKESNISKKEEERTKAINAIVLHSKKVGEEYLKKYGFKVRTRKLDRPTNHNQNAFNKGKMDSKTIDIGRKGITAKARNGKKESR